MVLAYASAIHFLSGHCRRRHYMFSVKKCEKLDCAVCDFPRLPHLFQDLHHLPDPIPMREHFRYGTEITEEYWLSLKEAKVKSLLCKEENRTKEEKHNQKRIGRSSLHMLVGI